MVIISSFNNDNKDLEVTKGEAIGCLNRNDNSFSLALCSHKEADIRIMLHEAYAANHCYQQIQKQTVDSDIVFVAVMVVQDLTFLDELWIDFGTDKNYRYFPEHEIRS